MLAANYFNYFTEIEEHYCRRRGTHLQVSTLDWALIETWKDAGIPLEAVLRGIDEAFDRYDQRKSKSRKVNSLAYCAQAVLSAAEDMKEAAVGTDRAPVEAPGLDGAAVAAYLRRNSEELRRRIESLPAGAQAVARDAAASLTAAAAEVEQRTVPALEDLERLLTVLEEKLLAALLAAAADAALLAIRADADRDLAPYRRNLTADQIERLYRQYVHKRLLERHGLPRLSLFYM
jgi:hypothetical protein